MDALEPRRLFARGLTGVFFSDEDFNTPERVNVDQQINFGTRPLSVSGSIDPGVSLPEGSARWTGQVVAKFSEYYTFYVQTDGGVRLWVNDKLLVEEPGNTQPHEFAGKMKMKFIAGQTYNIRLDYAGPDQNSGYLSLLWSSTRTPKQVIPTSRLRSIAKTPAKVRISFRPADAERADLYRVDSGQVYGARGLGLYYGWDEDNSANIFDRDSARSYSERYDGVALMDADGQQRSWRIKVPNGAYNVRVVSGDPTSAVGAYAIDVEGKRVIRGHPNQFSYWFDGTVSVNVNDGEIKLTNGAGSNKTRINFIEITPARDSDRLIAFFPIANGTTDLTNRTVVPDYLQNGWTPWVDQLIDPLIDQGYTRFHLHLPFGVETPLYWDLDAFLKAKEAGLNWLTDDFVQAFKPITAQGHEVIAYIGTEDDGAGFGTTDAQWFARFWAAFQPILDAKVSVAFDAGVLRPEQHNLYAAAQMLRARDIKVYVEARPLKANEQWGNFGVFSEEVWWQRSDPNQSADAADWALPDEQLTGEVVRWVFFPPEGYDINDPGWRVSQVQDVLRDGHTVSIYPSLHIDNVDLFWLLARANGYLGAIS
jgi:hypothetical protein